MSKCGGTLILRQQSRSRSAEVGTFLAMVFEASLTWLKAGVARILSFSSTFHIYMMSNINHVAQPSLLISGKSSILFISSICRRVLLLDTALQSLYTHADPQYNILNRFVSSVLSDADGTLNNSGGYQGPLGVALSQAPSMVSFGRGL